MLIENKKKLLDIWQKRNVQDGYDKSHVNNSILKNCNFINLTIRSAFSVALFTKLTVNLTGLKMHSAHEKFKYSGTSI